MASYHRHQFLNNHPNQVTRNSVSGGNRHGCSTAQVCLHKIIDLIVSSRSPPSSPTDGSDPGLNATRLRSGAPFGFSGFDLNIAPEDSPETKQSDSGDGDGEMSVVGGCDPSVLNKPNSEAECDPNLSNGVSEESVRGEGGRIGEPEEHGGEGCFGLLIEAANLIFGEAAEFGPERPSQSTRAPGRTELIAEEDRELIEIESDRHRGSKRNRFSVVVEGPNGDFEEVSPAAVKRGRRSQVLPFRYRDSVLEPLTRFSRHGSTLVPTKRKSRY